MPLRFPRGTTHVFRFGLGTHEAYYKRLGRLVYGFNRYRNEWDLLSVGPAFLDQLTRVKDDQIISKPKE